MAISVVKNVKSRAYVAWPGAVLLFLGLLAGCAAVPAAFFWLVLNDGSLAAIAIAVGFVIACCSFPLLLRQ
jgi:hypothetical protein